MKIIVIGGSIGGLSAAIALSCKGFDVAIYERSQGDMHDRGAGLVIQPDMMDYLNEHHISTEETFGVPVYERQVLNGKGDIVHAFANDTSFTSWSYVWQQLKFYFPAEKYFFGHTLQKIEEQGDTVTAHFANGVTETADLIVGADGYSSVTREHFLPALEPTYAGYIAYRGLIPEAALTDAEVSFFPYHHSHILCYMVPGANGALNKGERLYNWVWYVNKSQQELTQVLTDKTGVLRKYTVPPSFLSAASLHDLRDRADKELPAILRDRIHQTENPFVQVIVDLAVPNMYKNRIALLGEAAFVVRPHTASGTAKAYRDAIALANHLTRATIDDALAAWNKQQTQEANDLILYGKQLAIRSGLG